jgi:hypothetical protein
MTICLQGRGIVPEGRAVVGRWYQRYLPASNEHVPPRLELEQSGAKQTPECTQVRAQIQKLMDEKDGPPRLDPRVPEELERIRAINQEIRALRAQAARLCVPPPPAGKYSHPWKFLPESVFKAADQFSHFGVYDLVDSRMQYYLVTPNSLVAEAALERGQGGAWVHDGKQISVDAYSFRFNTMRLPWPPVPLTWLFQVGFQGLQQWISMVLSVNPPTAPLPPLPHPPRQRKAPPSLFNPDVRLRIVRRGSQWIALHWDKRDDDLMPFTGLPLSVELKHRKGPALEEDGKESIDVTLTECRRVEEPPVVRSAFFRLESYGGKIRAVLGFVPAPGGQRGLENLWRVRIAALDLDGSGQIVSLHDPVTVEKFMPSTEVQSKSSENIKTTGRPSSPLDPAPGDEPRPAKSYEYRWAPNPGQQAQLKEYCSFSGAMKYGTSIWFEDIVGHVTVPEVIQFPPAEDEDPQDRELKVTVEPEVVMAGPPVTFTVHAVDDKTKATVTGQVVIGAGRHPSGTTGQPITHAFGRAGARGVVRADGYLETKIPFEFEQAKLKKEKKGGELN